MQVHGRSGHHRGSQPRRGLASPDTAPQAPSPDTDGRGRGCPASTASQSCGTGGPAMPVTVPDGRGRGRRSGMGEDAGDSHRGSPGAPGAGGVCSGPGLICLDIAWPVHMSLGKWHRPLPRCPLDPRVHHLAPTHPGRPAASITLARVTSLDHTSYCHLRRPRTPQRTRPVCSPTRMFRSTSVASATDLQRTCHGRGAGPSSTPASSHMQGSLDRREHGGLLT